MPLSNEQLWESISQLASRPRHEKVRVLEYELLRKNERRGDKRIGLFLSVRGLSHQLVG